MWNRVCVFVVDAFDHFVIVWGCVCVCVSCEHSMCVRGVCVFGIALVSLIVCVCPRGV